MYRLALDNPFQKKVRSLYRVEGFLYPTIPSAQTVLDDEGKRKKNPILNYDLVLYA